MERQQSMADDYQYIELTGTIVPNTGEVKEIVENEYKSAFGQDLNVSPDTPQGVLITTEVLARSNMLRNNAALANQINPNLAGGVFLDAILALTGSVRNPAVHSTTRCVLTGVVGTFIAAGARAKLNTTGDEFESIANITLTGDEETDKVTFRAINSGPILVAEGTLTQIVSDILGWETVTNESGGTVGTTEQSDESARTLRRLTLGAQSVALPENIISQLYLVEGVKSLAFRENYTDEPIVIDDKTLVPHSIYVCIDGGDDNSIAEALVRSKSMGCAYNGLVEVPITLPISGQEYTVKFDRPTAIPILVRVTIRNDSSVQNPDDAVKTAIMNYVNGLIPGESGFVVNQPVSPFELSGAVNYYSPAIYVKKVEVALVSSGIYSTNEIAVNIHQIATLIRENITVVTA